MLVFILRNLTKSLNPSSKNQSVIISLVQRCTHTNIHTIHGYIIFLSSVNVKCVQRTYTVNFQNVKNENVISIITYHIAMRVLKHTFNIRFRTLIKFYRET